MTWPGRPTSATPRRSTRCCWRYARPSSGRRIGRRWSCSVSCRDPGPAGDERWRRVYGGRVLARRVGRGPPGRLPCPGRHRRDACHRCALRARGRGRRASGSVKFRLASFLAWGVGDLAEAEAMCRRPGRCSSKPVISARHCSWPASWRGCADCRAISPGWGRRRGRGRGGRRDGRLVRRDAGSARAGLRRGFRWPVRRAEPAISRAVSLAGEDGKSYRLTTALGMFAVMHSAVGRAPRRSPYSTRPSPAIRTTATPSSSNRAVQTRGGLELPGRGRRHPGGHRAEPAVDEQAACGRPGLRRLVRG